MSLSTAFQLSLDIFNLTQNSISDRRKIWKLLKPRMDAIASNYLQLLSTHTPYYRELATTKNAEVKRHIFKFTEALFTRPFDEQWVSDSKERTQDEVQFGLDMRNRCVINQVILVE